MAQQLPAPADTLAALHRLCAHQRQARTLRLTVGAGGTLTAASPDRGPLPAENYAALGASKMLLALLIEYRCYQRYSQRHEQRTAQEYRAGHRLPPGIQKKPHPRYFAPPPP